MSWRCANRSWPRSRCGRIRPGRAGGEGGSHVVRDRQSRRGLVDRVGLARAEPCLRKEPLSVGHDAADALRYLAMGMRETRDEKMPRIHYDDRGIV